MMTTTGTQEKCIDIQLAVEMMHFASVPGAYGRAVLELTSCTAAPHERRRTSCRSTSHIAFRRTGTTAPSSSRATRTSSPRSRASDRRGSRRGAPPLPHCPPPPPPPPPPPAPPPPALLHHHHLLRQVLCSASTTPAPTSATSPRSVALCSMLPHHSHPHSTSSTPAPDVRDFDPIWLDDFLDYLIVPFSSQAPAPPAPRPPAARAASASHARRRRRLARRRVAPPAARLAAPPTAHPPASSPPPPQSGPLAKSDEILSR